MIAEQSTKPFIGKTMLHVIGNSKFGGDTVYMFALSDMFRAGGGKVVICTSTKETIEVAKSKNIPVFTAPVIRRTISPLNDLWALFRMIKLCRTHDINIVHTHTSKAGVIGRIGARLGGVDHIIHTVHGFGFHSNTPRIKRMLYENIERVSALFCDVVISVNDEDRKTAIINKIVPKEKILTIKNGISKKRVESVINRSKFREELGVDKDQLLIGTISRFANQKDPKTFMYAARLVLKKHPNVRFLYAGDGPLFSEIKSLISDIGLKDRIILPGFVQTPGDYLKCLDIYVTTALYEGMPLSLLEAMCARVPAVVTNAKGNRECVTKSTALLVSPREPSEVAGAIDQLIENSSLRKKLAIEAYAKFRKEFSEERMLDQTNKVYKESLQAKKYYTGGVITV
jgi:glycosyltransferase involved in cell wall biosynthesis